MFGYCGKILEIDLTDGSIRKEPLDLKVARKYLGGQGLATKILFDNIDKETDPLSPNNLLIFMLGPLNGTSIPGQKTPITFKSPLTGILGHTKHGGSMCWELKFAGYDGIIIKGKSESPVFLSIKDEDVELKDASHIWGMDTQMTAHMIKEQLKDRFVRVDTIGPAGENMVRYANIEAEEIGRSASRCGGGAVMGSKKLKAIAVRGTKSVPLADPETFEKLSKEYKARMLKGMVSSGFGGGLSRWGTAAYGGFSNNCKNFLMPFLPESQEACSSERQEKRFWVRHHSCPGCVQQCFKRGIIRHGPFAGRAGENSEYDTSPLGLSCAVTDLYGFLNSVQLVDKLGLDGTSTGTTIAWVMECFEKGLLRREELDGLELTWGNFEAMDKLIRKIAFREGVGNLLAEGSKRAAEKIGRGTIKYAMQGKGLEFAAHDVRGKPMWRGVGTPINQATSSRGVGDHLSDLQSWADSAVVCSFAAMNVPSEEYEEYMVAFVKAATGWDYTTEEKATHFNRIITLRRAYNAMEGIRRSNDTLPERFFAEPIPSGPDKGKIVDHKEFQHQLDLYYQDYGWNNEGIPTKETLTKLDMEDVYTKLRKHRVYNQ